VSLNSCPRWSCVAGQWFSIIYQQSGISDHNHIVLLSSYKIVPPHLVKKKRKWKLLFWSIILQCGAEQWSTFHFNFHFIILHVIFHQLAISWPILISIRCFLDFSHVKPYMGMYVVCVCVCVCVCERAREMLVSASDFVFSPFILHSFSPVLLPLCYLCHFVSSFPFLCLHLVSPSGSVSILVEDI